MNDLIKVSIITVSYNAESTIEQTILSVFNQTYKNIEYIIIDGNSNDGTKDIIEKYKTKLSYYVSEPDGGIYDAMNKGIAHASGELIGIINSDDWYELDAVEKVVEHYQSTCADIISGQIRSLNVLGNVRVSKPNPLHDIWYLMPIAHPSTFIKRETYESYGMFDTKFRLASDYDLLLKFYIKGAHFEIFDDVIANFRLGGASSLKYMESAEETKNISLNYKQFWDKDYTQLIDNRYEEAKFVNTFNNDFKLILDIIRDYFFDIDSNTILFGVGMWGARFAINLKNFKTCIHSYVDNDSDKWNTTIEGFNVYSPELLKNGKWNVIIAARDYQEEISYQLNGYCNNELRWITIDEIKDRLLNYNRNIDKLEIYEELDINVIFKSFYPNSSELDRICVWGAGFNGRRMKIFLQLQNVNITYFGDSNEQLQGTTVLEVMCLSMNELEKYKCNTLVIVCVVDHYNEIKSELNKKGFPYVIDENELYNNIPINNKLANLAERGRYDVVTNIVNRINHELSQSLSDKGGDNENSTNISF